MTSLSEGAFRGYTNTEEGYLYFEEIVVVSVRSGLLESDLAWSWSNLNLFLAHTEKQNSANIEWLSVTTPVAKLCQSTTSTDGPTVLKNSPPGFYSSVV